MATRAQRQRVATGKTSDGQASKGTIPEADRAIVGELQARWDYAKQQKDPIRERGRKCVRYLTDTSWSDEDKRARVGRLTLHFDQLNQYRNLLVNTVRQQKRAIKVTPEGNGANDQTAQIRSDRIRQIEYLSNAQEAYTIGFEGATDRGYGYARIVAEWEPKGFKKRLRLRAVPNPDQVLEDPDGQSITGADWKYLFYSYDMSRDEFNRDYPDAVFKSYSSLSENDIAGARDWQSVDRVQVAEYWTVTLTKAKLVRLDNSASSDPESPTIDVFESERTDAQKLLPAINSRMADKPVVCWYLTNGVELLAKDGETKKHEWKGSRIPFKACYGRIVYTSTDTTAPATGGTNGTMARKLMMSYVDLALDAQKYYDYIKSSEAEVFKLNLLTPYRAHQGSLTPDQLLQYQASITTPVAVVFSQATSDDAPGQLLPLPERELPNLNTQGYEIASEAARRDIANAMGRSSVTDPRRGNARVESGVGLQELQKSGDLGSYHFIDAYEAMIAALGEDLEELLAYYDDTAEPISTRSASGVVAMVPVNGMRDKDGQPGPMMSTGNHATTISTGPSFDSEREEASAFADTLIGNQAIDRILGPQKASKLLALAIKLKNVGPLGDEMAEIVDPEQDDPKQLQQHLAQAMDQLKKQGAVLEEMHGIIQGKTLELQGKKYETDEDNKTKIRIAEINAGAALGVADIKADLEHSLQLMSTQLQTVQGLVEAHQAQLDRVHDAQAQLEAQAHAAQQAATPPPVDPNAAPAEPAGAPA